MFTKYRNIAIVFVLIVFLFVASIALSQNTAGEACRNSSGTANIRNNPSLTGVVIGGLSENTCVGFYATVTGEAYNWAYIDNPFDGNRGWVADNLVNVISTPLPFTPEATPTQETVITATPTPNIAIDTTENSVIIRLIVELIFPIGE